MRGRDTGSRTERLYSWIYPHVSSGSIRVLCSRLVWGQRRVLSRCSRVLHLVRGGRRSRARARLKEGPYLWIGAVYRLLETQARETFTREFDPELGVEASLGVALSLNRWLKLAPAVRYTCYDITEESSAPSRSRGCHGRDRIAPRLLNSALDEPLDVASLKRLK
jgi:hypothetical protein